jgi:hypothetical protein
MTGRTRSSDAPTCVLRIEELVLQGFQAVDRHAIADAIAGELGRLLGEAGTLKALRGRDLRGGDHRLDAGAFVVPSEATPHAVGIQVARAIHRGLEGPRASASAGPSPARDSSASGGAR